jgi:hypothetical protein
MRLASESLSNLAGAPVAGFRARVLFLSTDLLDTKRFPAGNIENEFLI